MTFNKIIRKSVLFSFVIFFVLSLGNVKAAEANNEDILLLNNVKKVSNENVVKYNFSKDKQYVTAKISSKKLSKGYYTTIFYDKLDFNFLNYQMISFNISNESKGDLKINFLINNEDKTNISLINNKPVLLKKETSQSIEKVFSSYGSIAIPKGFKGMIYIPFSSLGKPAKSDKTNKLTIYDTPAWLGIAVITPENEEKTFTFSDFKLITSNSALLKLSNLNFSFVGDDKVQLPVVGESIARYSTNISELNSNKEINQIKFKIDSPEKGISISNDGILKIETGVQPHKIKIDAYIDKYSIYISKEIQLYKSWTLNNKNKDNTQNTIPKIEEISRFDNGLYGLISSSKIMNSIRIFLIILSLLCIFIYLSSNRKKDNF